MGCVDKSPLALKPGPLLLVVTGQGMMQSQRFLQVSIDESVNTLQGHCPA